jgi:hypothetical protein
MNNFCIFRNVNDCKNCFFKTKYNKYCSIHINNKNIIYEIINKAIGIRQIKNSHDIYEIFRYIYDTPDIYVKELIFKKILKTLFIKQWTLRSKYYYLTNYCNYDTLIDIIFKLNLNTYKIEKKINNNQLLRIKRFLNFTAIKKHTYNPSLKYINESDPFTFDILEEIPLTEKFIFSEDNNYYCFRALEFKYFIRNNGNWNPYTKKQINFTVMSNLDKFIDYFKLQKEYNNQWKTLLQAFTDVSIAIEKIGFYTNTQWFITLTHKQIRNIIRLFHVISSRNNHNQIYNFFTDLMIINNEDTNNNQMYYYFAKEIIRLFENGNANFLLCCNFMKAIGVYSNDFYNSLPDWLSDIESPIIINNYYSRDLVYLINIIES